MPFDALGFTINSRLNSKFVVASQWTCKKVTFFLYNILLAYAQRENCESSDEEQEESTDDGCYQTVNDKRIVA